MTGVTIYKMILTDLIYFLTLQLFIHKMMNYFSPGLFFFILNFTGTHFNPLEFVRFPQDCKINDVHCLSARFYRTWKGTLFAHVDLHVFNLSG